MNREEGRFRVHAAFPGGNGIVDRVDGDRVYLRQDLRDTKGDWFYWCFEVEGAAGRRLTFEFTRGNVIGVLGPAASEDAGRTWRWLGAEVVRDASFIHAFPPASGPVRFSFGMPYLEANLRGFVQGLAGNPCLRAEALCRTPKGREVERLHAGRLDGKPRHRVLVACRHHCCEMMANYSLEGLLGTAICETPEGRWLRKNVEILAVPFVDKDGVEEGDQGKSRRPHDHNRDYGEPCLYESVRALRAFVPGWADGRLRVAFDLHCPWIRGPNNEVVYQVGAEQPEMWQEQKRFSKTLESAQDGVLAYRSSDDLPFGQSWNVPRNYGSRKTFSVWAAEIPGMRLSTAIEIPYANANGREVNQTTAREFGRDLARALCEYLRGIPA